MVHYGKHIIDPQTGLCEICDRGAIHEIRHGKRHGKQFLYSNQDGKFTYRSNDDNEVNYDNEATPRHVRKPLYPEPPPPQPTRTRPVVQEQPVAPHRKVTRRDHSPVDHIKHNPTAGMATLYYVDNTGQMVPRSNVLSDESHRTYIVQNHNSPPTRPAHTVRRHAKTPPPPASDSMRSQPRRKNNSDTRIIERQHRENADDSHFHQSPRRAEMYFVEAPHNNNNFTALRFSFQPSHSNNTPSPRMNPHGDPHRKHRQLEPIQRVNYTEIEPAATRRTHKKLSPTYDPYEEEHVPNGNHQRPIRKLEKIYPTPRQYESEPQLSNKHLRNPSHNKNPSLYYIQTVNGY
ncbi:unnamed protein product [Rotaria socialis]|uniref:Uncharacterized protein n=2 Tax=Rotaria socialis TaxID=392032 RepID=A0A820CKD0_9BILA|nr:unnamed protein product [Rotaria socialis]CAF4222523.1 unnamed protein product [Rotaria socialis]